MIKERIYLIVAFLLVSSVTAYIGNLESYPWWLVVPLISGGILSFPLFWLCLCFNDILIDLFKEYKR